MKLFIIANVISFTISASAQNMVYTFGGNGVAGLTNGAVANSQFNSPTGICRDLNGNLYVADCYNNCIRKIDSLGIVTTYAGSAVAGFQDGPAATAKFNQPFCICSDDSGILYVSDFNNQRIRKISVSGTVSTLAGSGIEGYNDGADSTARFDYPRGITIDAQGNLYVADSWNHRIRKIDAITHNVSTYAGGGTVTGVGTAGGYIDAGDTAARFHTPTGIVIDAGGNLYVADAYNHRIRMIDNFRYVSTVAGSGAAGGFMDGTALSARFNTPTDLYRTPGGDLFISDTFNNRVRLLSGGIVTTMAGNGMPGFVNGSALSSRFNYPRSITANYNADSVWITDYNNHAIRLITTTPAGVSEPLKKVLLFYPDPVRDVIHIRLPGMCDDYQVKISDITGKTLYFKEGTCKSSEEIRTAMLAPGVYLINITTAGFSIVDKFVKE